MERNKVAPYPDIVPTHPELSDEELDRLIEEGIEASKKNDRVAGCLVYHSQHGSNQRAIRPAVLLHRFRRRTWQSQDLVARLLLVPL